MQKSPGVAPDLIHGAAPCGGSSVSARSHEQFSSEQEGAPWLRTRARIWHKKHDRVLRQANERIQQSLSGDQRRILALSSDGYAPGEIARELALSPEYVLHFMNGLVERLNHEGLIPSPDWRRALDWAVSENLLPDQL